MNLKVRMLVLLIALFALTLASAAQEETVTELPEDNACYAGGSLEGKCDWPTDAEDEWAWTCGWYIARAENGVIWRADVPEWCNYFTNPAFTPVCYPSSEPEFPDLEMIAPVDTRNNGRFYISTDGTCSGDYLAFTVIAAPPVEESLEMAYEKCASITGATEVFTFPIGLFEIFVGLPTDYWICLTEDMFTGSRMPVM